MPNKQELAPQKLMEERSHRKSLLNELSLFCVVLKGLLCFLTDMFMLIYSDSICRRDTCHFHLSITQKLPLPLPQTQKSLPSQPYQQHTPSIQQHWEDSRRGGGGVGEWGGVTCLPECSGQGTPHYPPNLAGILAYSRSLIKMSFANSVAQNSVLAQV